MSVGYIGIRAGAPGHQKLLGVPVIHNGDFLRAHAFIIYGVMVVTLIVRPQGLFARGDAR